MQSKSELRIVALIPAYNEEASIGQTVEAMVGQDRVPDQIVVIPNGCTDGTASVARQFPVTVLELPRLEHKKSEALNRAWTAHGGDADVIICLDADTVLPRNAVADWEAEFIADASRGVQPKPVLIGKRADAWWDQPAVAEQRKVAQAISVPVWWDEQEGEDPPSTPRGVRALPLGGSSSKFTMRGDDFLTRLQRAEFSRWTDTALRRGWTSVLAGTGAAISGEALRQVAARDDREGPWAYTSQVEDFELTYRIRELGYRCQVSPTVRAYTDSMKTVKALWGQRMKWQVGTIEDLLLIGVNRLTYMDWWQQLSGIFAALARYLWLAVILALCLLGELNFQWIWWVLLPIFFVALQVRHALRIPHRDGKDLVYAFLIYPAEAFAWLRAAWFTAAWIQAPIALLVGRRKDRWTAQYSAEAFTRGLLGRLRLAGFRVGAFTVTALMAVLAVGNLYPRSGLPNVAAIAELGPAAAVDHSAPEICSGHVALTYDDGPTEHTIATSDLLARYQLHATFFLVGVAVVERPDAVRALLANGHEVGNHTRDHPYLSQMPLEKAQAEITDNAVLIDVLAGQRPTLFRPPYGDTTPAIVDFAAQQGMPATLWTLDTEDLSGKTAAEVDDAVSLARDGDIILMHDDLATDVRTVPLIAATLRRLNLCTGRIVPDAQSHYIASINNSHSVKVVPW